MKVEQVKLLKTLKAGKQVWVEGSYFPNNEYPSIPSDILLEVHLGKNTVEVTQQSEENVIQLPQKTKSTSTSLDIATSTTGRASLEEALTKEKRDIESVVLPIKRKSKLVRRK